MSLLERFIDTAKKNYTRQQDSAIRQAERQINSHSQGNLTNRQKEILSQKREQLERMKDNRDKGERSFDRMERTASMVSSVVSGVASTVKHQVNNQTNNKDSIIGGKTLVQWNTEWICIGHLATADLSPYNHSVGIYRHEVNGQVY